jgi:hypothetical protein
MWPNPITIAIPEAVAFEPSKDFARHCGGSVYRISEAASNSPDLAIDASDGWLRFICQRKVQEYLIARIKFISVSLFEEVKHYRICTLRVFFSEENGDVSGLPVVSNFDGSQRKWFEALPRILKEAGFPYEVECRAT